VKSGSSFLLAARQCEIAELEQLADTAQLVGAIGRLIHALQRERGVANIFLSSRGERFREQRERQAAESAGIEEEVHARFGALQADAVRWRHGSRLFSRVAVAVHGLEGLPALRARVAALALGADEASTAYSKLVAGLLAVVFEAADASTDPEISRALVAMFNFMQGKEYAGQERALGSRAFAAGALDDTGRQQWRHLVDAQQASFQVFADFSDPEILRAEQASRSPAVQDEVDRLRRIGCAPGVLLNPDLTARWYDTCTQRMDSLRELEVVLARHVRGLCETRIAQAHEELRDQRALVETLEAQAASGHPAPPYGPQVERSMVALLHDQSRRLQAMSDELDAVRATLNERKLVEKAKGLLMAHRQMSEDEAYKALRQMAMNQNKRLVDVASAVLSLVDVLPGGAR
jgi:hypothetical protein